MNNPTLYGAYGDMLQNFYQEKFARIRRRRQSRLKKIIDQESAKNYSRMVREDLRRLMLPVQPEKCPLHTVVSGKIQSGNVIIEKLIFDTLPELKMSALLYHPVQVNGKIPGIAALCGHSPTGKDFKPYQRFCYRLAQLGFEVICPDPISQGERLQFPDGGDEFYTEHCCLEHNLFNKELLLFGQNIAELRLWECVRTLDCLLERQEIDSTRVGVTGCSGGGTMTSYLWAYDERLTMAAPCCYLTTFYRNFENELPVDGEQAIPGIAAAGLEMSDFLASRAPLPTIVLMEANDFFDPRGGAECVAEAKRIYKLLGAENALNDFTAGGNHDYSAANCEAMCRFFCKQAELEYRYDKEEITDLKKIRCTPGNSTVNLPGAISLPQLLAQRTMVPRPAATLRNIKKFLGLRLPTAAPDYNVLRNRRIGDRLISIYGIASEPGIRAFLHTVDSEEIHQLRPAVQTTLIVAANDAEAELVADNLHAASGEIFVLDVRGFGKSAITTSDRNSDKFSPYAGEYFYDAAGLMLDSPLFKGRCQDILAAIKLLHECGAEKINLAGRGLNVPCVLCAAAYAGKRINGLTLEDFPDSMSQAVGAGGYRQPQSYAPVGMLNVFDFPELTSLLEKLFPVEIISRRNRFFETYR